MSPSFRVYLTYYSIPLMTLNKNLKQLVMDIRKTVGVGLVAVLSVLSVSVPAIMNVPVSAATPPATPAAKTDDAASVPQSTGTVQSYASDKPLQVGTIVQLEGSGDKAKVSPSKFDKASQMYGVAVDPRSLPVTVSNSGLKNETFVAASGTYGALVSTQNGPIKTGDYVTISAVDGVAMLAQPEQKLVFGRAAANFDGKNNVVSTVTLKDSSGKDLNKVAIGSIPVVIDIRKNPNEKSTKTNLPQFLQRLGEAIAEKPVGPLRIYLSIAITGICIIAAIVILYSGIRSSIISIGRNPLSKKSIFRALLEIILTSLIVLIVGLFAVYLLLKL